ncbi:MAG TPA: DUF2071 domain-containing protein [Solirubrobacterales bacterium]|nr:DUF2071 domain-containing protein [Solirubrobacterales bacterium]
MRDRDAIRRRVTRDRPRPLDAIATAIRQRGVLAETEHRPWPLPERPWFMGQSWRDLLFAHWRVDADALRRVVPPQLELHLYDGAAWLGVTPFKVEGLRLRNTPPPPVLSRFLEVNVRTYVEVDGKPGIYFLSLDTESRSAVAAARRGYRLPYFHARQSRERIGEGFAFHSERVSADGPPAAMACEYTPARARLPVKPGSLERWLSERYCLYTLAEGGTVQRADIHHPPWPLQPAEGSFTRNTMAHPYGIELEGEPLLHYSAIQDVVLWTIAPAGGA